MMVGGGSPHMHTYMGDPLYVDTPRSTSIIGAVPHLVQYLIIGAVPHRWGSTSSLGQYLIIDAVPHH